MPFTPDVPCDDVGTTCQLTMDVLAPTAAGTRPIVLFVAGGPNPLTNQGYVMDAGFPVAVHDAVVMQPVWRQDRDQGGGWPTSFQDIACAVGVARAVGPDYGGDPGRVVLVGHSLGGWASAVVALSPKDMTPAPAPATPPAAHCGRTRWSPSPAPSTSTRRVRAGRGSCAASSTAAGPSGRSDGRSPTRSRWQRSTSQVPVTVVHGTGDTTVNPAVARAFATRCATRRRHPPGRGAGR